MPMEPKKKVHVAKTLKCKFHYDATFFGCFNTFTKHSNLYHKEGLTNINRLTILCTTKLCVKRIDVYGIPLLNSINTLQRSFLLAESHFTPNLKMLAFEF